MFEELTAYIPKLQEGQFGEWIVDTNNDGSPEHPIQFPFVNYIESVTAFMKAVYRFVDTHQAMDIRNYSAILEEADLKWDYTIMSNADVTDLTGRTVMALILGAIRADRFCEGTLLRFLNEGHIIKWLQRLKQIDLEAEEKPEAPSLVQRWLDDDDPFGLADGSPIPDEEDAGV